MTTMATQAPPASRPADSEAATFVTYFSLSPRFCHHHEVGCGTTATASSAARSRETSSMSGIAGNGRESNVHTEPLDDW